MYPGPHRTRRALACHWLLVKTSLLFKTLFVTLLLFGAVAMFGIGISQILDGAYAVGGKSIAIALSSVGGTVVLIRYLEEGIKRNRREKSIAEHMLLKFDQDCSQDFQAAYGKDEAERTRLFNKKHFDYMDELRKKRCEIFE